MSSVILGLGACRVQSESISSQEDERIKNMNDTVGGNRGVAGRGRGERRG